MNNSNYTFSFKFETQEKFSKLIQNLKCNKATQQYDIPIKILKENSEIFSYILCHNFNSFLFSKVFPNSLKKVDIIPVFEKDEKFLKKNYRPVNILPSVCTLYIRPNKRLFSPTFFETAMWISKRISLLISFG